MEGDLEGDLRGVIPRTVEDIFNAIETDPEPSTKYLVRASYLQVRTGNWDVGRQR
jgi:kinesin family protein 3/17